MWSIHRTRSKRVQGRRDRFRVAIQNVFMGNASLPRFVFSVGYNAKGARFQISQKKSYIEDPYYRIIYGSDKRSVSVQRLMLIANQIKFIVWCSKHNVYFYIALRLR